MSDETTAVSTSQTTSTSETLTPYEVNRDRVAQQGKYAAMDDAAMQAFIEKYEAAGGKYFAQMREQLEHLQQREKAHSELEGQVGAIQRERALERALRIHKLDDSDVELFPAGLKPDEIEEFAERLAARIKGNGKKSDAEDDDERPARKTREDEPAAVTVAEKLSPREEFVRGFKQDQARGAVSQWPPRAVR